MAFYEEFERLKIQLEDVKSSTDNFAENKVIGYGGFGKVYKGEISHSKGESMDAFKRLDTRLGQGNPEFWKEIMMLSRYTHENLVSLLGYCDEGGEKILVYEHASRGSLDRHLRSATLTWIQRIKICLAASRGLSYLHDHQGTLQRVLHRDIKSANILLDENWNAKVSDLGLSKIGPANQEHTLLVSNAVGTPGYCDPLYMEMGFLTKESDVYSFGVVLFEVLCGRLCYGDNNGRWEILVHMWKQSFEQNKLDEIIFQDLKRQMEPSSLRTFSDIAYQCLQRSREERPPIAHVVKQLEIALESQHLYEVIEVPEEYKVPKEYEVIIKTAVPALIFGSEEELNMRLSKGILVNGGNTWFSLNKKGQHCEIISAAEFLTRNLDDTYVNSPKYNSRGQLCSTSLEVQCTWQSSILVPTNHIHSKRVVFKFLDGERNSAKPVHLGLKYKLNGETNSSIAHLADGREDGWMMVELCQFTSDRTDFYVSIQFKDSKFHCYVAVEGIEFRPWEKVEDELKVLEDDKVDMQDSEIDWEQKLPNDYEEIIKWSKDSLEWTTKKELYSLFRKGFLINKGEEWFSLAKNGKKCPTLSARDTLPEKYLTLGSQQPISRFDAMDLNAGHGFYIECKFKSQIMSPQTTYACYLVYKIVKYNPTFEVPVEVIDYEVDLYDYWPLDKCWFIYLLGPQTPVLSRRNVDQNTHNPSNIPKIKGFPRQRNDGWMEVQVGEFRTGDNTEIISMYFCLRTPTYGMFTGLTMQGIELKPL